jgi:NAD(P)-dependent dehydrogenase (short-subunit alcohol dehydrogenase family)
MDLGIADHVAIVTGGGAGIGARTCVALASEGANLAVADLNVENAQKVAEEVSSYGVRAIALEVDVSDLNQTQAMVEKPAWRDRGSSRIRRRRPGSWRSMPASTVS